MPPMQSSVSGQLDGAAQCRTSVVVVEVVVVEVAKVVESAEELVVGVLLGVTAGVLLGVTTGVLLGVLLGVVLGVVLRVPLGVLLAVLLRVPLGVVEVETVEVETVEELLALQGPALIPLMPSVARTKRTAGEIILGKE